MDLRTAWELMGVDLVQAFFVLLLVASLVCGFVWLCERIGGK